MSKPYDIQRGTKQGDPLSTLLFNCLIEDVVDEVKKEWLKKGWGLKLGFTECTQLTNLRFADDILLVAGTLRQTKAMLKNIKQAAAKVGLELHPDKTKILSNATRGTGRPKDTKVMIDGMSIEIVPYSGSVKYLGRLVGFDRPHDVEINNRIRNS